MAYEKLRYEVLKKEGPYEVRKYEPFTKMVTKSNYDSGFSKLFRYISGNNSENKKISMTVPVISDLADPDMAFTMPRDAGEAPEPVDGSISIVKEPERYYLSYTFRGNKSLERVVFVMADYAERRRLKVIGSHKIMTYQGPLTPWFLKTYDVIVEIENDPYGF